MFKTSVPNHVVSQFIEFVRSSPKGRSTDELVEQGLATDYSIRSLIAHAEAVGTKIETISQESALRSPTKFRFKVSI